MPDRIVAGGPVGEIGQIRASVGQRLPDLVGDLLPPQIPVGPVLRQQDDEHVRHAVFQSEPPDVLQIVVESGPVHPSLRRRVDPGLPGIGDVHGLSRTVRGQQMVVVVGQKLRLHGVHVPAQVLLVGSCTQLLFVGVVRKEIDVGDVAGVVPAEGLHHPGQQRKAVRRGLVGDVVAVQGRILPVVRAYGGNQLLQPLRLPHGLTDSGVVEHVSHAELMAVFQRLPVHLDPVGSHHQVDPAVRDLPDPLLREEGRGHVAPVRNVIRHIPLLSVYFQTNSTVYSGKTFRKFSTSSIMRSSASSQMFISSAFRTPSSRKSPK